MNRFIRYATTIAHKPKLTIEQITEIYNKPLLELVYQASTVHRQNHNPNKIQLCTLLNIKSGGCTEDCSYCSQSSRHKTDSPVTKLMEVDQVLQKAREAKANGSTRFCMGSAWRDMAGKFFATLSSFICLMLISMLTLD
jgi:biotin synthase